MESQESLVEGQESLMEGQESLVEGHKRFGNGIFSPALGNLSRHVGTVKDGVKK
jgi:hypothetical protein